LVQPQTVIGWHRKGFQHYWRFLSRRKTSGRLKIDKEIRQLIHQMVQSNPLWGAPRVHGELLKLGFEVSEPTVSRLMPRKPQKPSSQAWRAFLANHSLALVSMDFLVVPTATFRLLCVQVLLSHQRQRVIHFNITAHPTAAWEGSATHQGFS
jgi:putative transposase